uniref:Uncharacterized protein n=1 Tax=Nelumbo nucifera TaxID=4432 RepID=A0A822Y7N7_NELNU|nr:TPA_asm: hypothetical protein HUJ06_028694 [Nelumbo nucifera]
MAFFLVNAVFFLIFTIESAVIHFGSDVSLVGSLHKLVFMMFHFCLCCKVCSGFLL